LQMLAKAIEGQGVPPQTLELMHLRASQINGCAVCLDMHWRALKKYGASNERIATVAAWRETPYFTDAERAALALTEAATRLADRRTGASRLPTRAGAKRRATTARPSSRRSCYRSASSISGTGSTPPRARRRAPGSSNTSESLGRLREAWNEPSMR